LVFLAGSACRFSAGFVASGAAACNWPGWAALTAVLFTGGEAALSVAASAAMGRSSAKTAQTATSKTNFDRDTTEAHPPTLS
jgi:hypothetical protein